MKKTILFCVLAMAATTGIPYVQVKAAPYTSCSALAYTEDEIVLLVLTKAAPEFELTVSAMLNAYAANQVTIEPDTSNPGTYLVTYGGIGILIVIDGS